MSNKNKKEQNRPLLIKLDEEEKKEEKNNEKNTSSLTKQNNLFNSPIYNKNNSKIDNSKTTFDKEQINQKEEEVVIIEEAFDKKENKKYKDPRIYNFFTKWPLLFILLSILLSITFGLICTLVGYYNFSDYMYKVSTSVLYGLGTIMLFICWVVPNHTANKYRKENKEYDAKLPISVKNEMYKIRYPFLISALCIILIGLIFELVILFL